MDKELRDMDKVEDYLSKARDAVDNPRDLHKVGAHESRMINMDKMLKKYWQISLRLKQEEILKRLKEH